MWYRFKISFLAAFVAAVLGTPGCTQPTSESVVPAPTPIFSRIHTVSIHVKDLETFDRAFHLLRDDLELSKKWGQEWTPGSKAKKMYAGFWAGNICIEPCGPYDTDEFESDARAMFFAITFLPFESSRASARELDRRGLAHNGEKVFLSVTDPHLSSGNSGVCIMDVGPEDREKDNAREVELQIEFASAQKTSLGLIGVEEILVRYTCEEGRKRWERLLQPVRPNAENLWRLGDSPAIRLIKDSRTGIAGVVWKVRSLATATKVLKERDMLGKVQDRQVRIVEKKACGLTIILRE
jgi:hypothetical protein